MPASAAPSSSRRPDVLRAELQDVKLLTSLIRPVQIAAVANLSISNAGIRVTTELDRSIQAVAYVAEGLFKTFEFTPPPEGAGEESGGGADGEDEEEASVDFDINLNTLLDCLTIFSGSSYHQQQNQQQQQQGAATSGNGNAPNTGLHPLRDESSLRPHVSLRLQWRGHGHPLILLLTPERDSSSRCEIATFEAAVPLGFQYHHDETQAQVIMSSEFLADAMAGIDVKACEKVQLLFTNSYEGPANAAADLTRSRAKLSAPPSTGATSTSAATSLPPGQAMFKLTWSGGQHGGSSDVEFPYSDDSEGDKTVLEKFTCERQTAHWYRWAHVHHLVKGLQSSLRCSARVARGRGLLSVQLMMPGGGAGDEGGGGGRYGQKAAGRMGGGMMKSDATHGFLDFLIAPLDEEGDNNDEDDEEEDGLGEETRHQDDGGGHDDTRSSRGASRAQSNSGSASPVPSNRRKRGGGGNVGDEDEDEDEEEEGDRSADKKRRTTRADSLDSLDDEEF